MLNLSSLDRTELEALASSLLQDSLTKVYNLHAVTMSEQDYLDGYLILFDVDDFKNFNTRYGHSGGDNALQVVASAIREETDFAFRCGGDEFGAYVKCNGLEQAKEIAERILDKCFDWNLGSIPCSIGVVPVAGRSYFEARNACDKLVYQAKDLGKNCVVASNI